MRFSEICSEDYLKIKETEDAADDMSASVVTMLQFLKHRAVEKNAAPKMKTQSFIQLVQNTGYKNFGYDDLVAANENNDTVKNMIKSFNKDELILNLTGNPEGEDNTDNKPQRDPEDTVNSMAKRAADV